MDFALLQNQIRIHLNPFNFRLPDPALSKTSQKSKKNIKLQKLDMQYLNTSTVFQEILNFKFYMKWVKTFRDT